MESYSRQMDLPDLKFFKDMLLTIKGTMLADMFSNEFTNLTADEKDVWQRTYFNLNQWLDFLLSPSRYMTVKKSRIMSQMEKLTTAKREKATADGAKGTAQ